jgi:hypothetical protein
MKVNTEINAHGSQCTGEGKVLTDEKLLPIVKHTMKVIMKINVHISQCIGRGRLLLMKSFYPL